MSAWEEAIPSSRRRPAVRSTEEEVRAIFRPARTFTSNFTRTRYFACASYLTSRHSANSLSIVMKVDTLMFVLFVCLFWIRTRICPAGSTPEGGPTEKLPYHPGHLSPPGLVVLHVPYPPILIVMHPASGQSPPLSSCPIQISYQVSGLPPPCLPVLHI